MSTRIITTAHGNIVLRNEYNVSASGHDETNAGADLYAVADKKLMLHIYDSRSGLFANINELNENCYEIDVDQLIDFIKQNGVRTSRKDRKMK